MKSITVHMDDKPIYDIVYTTDFKLLPELIINLGFSDRKICVVSEDNVASLYEDAILLSLSESFTSISSFIFKSGEGNKNLNTVKDLYSHLIANKFDRNDLIVALGGGVTGDLAGYAAATYLRGIDFIQVPTSLIAQVDSSIGGKTGVDFDAYKNMIGAFHMPRLVYMNINVLGTLDDRQFTSGMGEIVKHSIIKSNNFYNWLISNKANIYNKDIDVLQHMIMDSCEIKRAVVEHDPTEKGERALLNFGHTLGHALEKYMNFELLHGECVFIGCILASIISYNKGILSKSTLNDIVTNIKSYSIPVLPSDLDINQIVEYTSNDKKATGNKVKFILIKDIGKAYIDTSVNKSDMRTALEQYMKDINEK